MCALESCTRCRVKCWQSRSAGLDTFASPSWSNNRTWIIDVIIGIPGSIITAKEEDEERRVQEEAQLAKAAMWAGERARPSAPAPAHAPRVYYQDCHLREAAVRQ